MRETAYVLSVGDAAWREVGLTLGLCVGLRGRRTRTIVDVLARSLVLLHSCLTRRFYGGRRTDLRISDHLSCVGSGH